MRFHGHKKTLHTHTTLKKGKQLSYGYYLERVGIYGCCLNNIIAMQTSRLDKLCPNLDILVQFIIFWYPNVCYVMNMSIQTPIQNIRFHFRPTHLSNWQSCNSIERYHKPVGYELIYMQWTWRQNVLLPPLNVTLFFFKAFVCTNFAITNVCFI